MIVNWRRGSLNILKLASHKHEWGSTIIDFSRLCLNKCKFETEIDGPLKQNYIFYRFFLQGATKPGVSRKTYSSQK
jgi:hypothetical protein